MMGHRPPATRATCRPGGWRVAGGGWPSGGGRWPRRPRAGSSVASLSLPPSRRHNACLKEKDGTDEQNDRQTDKITDGQTVNGQKDKWTFSGRLLSSSRIAVFVEECRGLPSSWRIATFVEDCHLRGRLRLRGVLPWEAGKGERGSRKGEAGKGKRERDRGSGRGEEWAMMWENDEAG